MKFVGNLFLFISINCVYSQESFHKEIDRIYNFQLHKLTKEQKAAKFEELNAFFVKIKFDTLKYFPQIRKELKTNTHKPYFYYDCAHSMMILSSNPSDNNLIAMAFSKCDLKDIDAKVFVSLLNNLAIRKANVTQAALKIIADESFSFYVPEHDFYFTNDYSLLYCLLPMDSKLYVEALTELYYETTDLAIQKTIVLVLWHTYSCESEAFLKQVLNSKLTNPEIKSYLKTVPNSIKSSVFYKKNDKKITMKDLMELQKASFNRFSDEAIADLNYIAMTRRKKQKCQE